MNVKCLIIDDEQLARELLATYCSKIPNLEVVAQCKNPLEAIDIIQQEKIDLHSNRKESVVSPIRSRRADSPGYGEGSRVISEVLPLRHLGTGMPRRRDLFYNFRWSLKNEYTPNP